MTGWNVVYDDFRIQIPYLTVLDCPTYTLLKPEGRSWKKIREEFLQGKAKHYCKNNWIKNKGLESILRDQTLSSTELLQKWKIWFLYTGIIYG